MTTGGLYCPPLIPARIWQNLGNSWNSGGIKFGTGVCQIDYTILAECRTEFQFRWNGSRNHTEGMAPWNDRNRIVDTHHFFLSQPPPSPPLTMPTTVASLCPHHPRLAIIATNHHHPHLSPQIHYSSNNMATPRQHEGWNARLPLATKQRMMTMSLFAVVVYIPTKVCTPPTLHPTHLANHSQQQLNTMHDHHNHDIHSMTNTMHDHHIHHIQGTTTTTTTTTARPPHTQPLRCHPW